MVRIALDPPESRIITAALDSPGPDEEIRIQCRLDCMCGGFRVQWMPAGGGPLPTGVETTSLFNSGRELTLVFSAITFEVAGEYVCVASSNSQPDMVQQTVTVEVLIPSQIKVMPDEVSVQAGSDAKLVCVANRPVTQFVWTYRTLRGEPFPSSATVTNINSTVSELVVRNMQNNVNTGQYFCQGLFQGTFDEKSESGNILVLSECAY